MNLYCCYYILYLLFQMQPYVLMKSKGFFLPPHCILNFPPQCILRREDKYIFTYVVMFMATLTIPHPTSAVGMREHFQEKGIFCHRI